MKGWTTSKLKDVAKVITGKTPQTSNREYYDGNIPFVSPADLNESILGETKTYLTDLGADQVYRVPKDTVLVSCIGNLGKITIVDREVCFNQQINGLVFDKNKIFPKYGFYCAQTLKPQLEKASSSTTLPIVNKSRFSDLTINFPPLEEQRRIASILDKADELRQKRKQAIVKLDQLLQATFIDMFGDPSNNPNNYNQYELDTLILIGPQNGLYKPATMYGEGIPIVRIDGFKSGDIIDNKGFKRLSLEQSDIEKYQLNKFDLVINRVNSPEYIGKTALVRNLEEPTVFESNMMRFSVDTKKLNPYFLLFFLKQQFVLNQIANKRKDAVNQSSINQQDVKSLVINIPPIEKQLLFANFFEKVEINKHLFYKQYVNFNNLFKSLQNKAFSGNL
ncbi:restriction endonuclease subunit S [Acinetobacter silvestris]|uniref:Type I restriction modification DNA specificity domain-containing protein n=1 Tax=Acinetobacter silvestris TaxID=1977882 RepID=A0A1Y3CK81_9GAMM|nr:restriction endonuclease subunit S [Acinetobacter silvestris]OTG65543.1 hypothetical protein B9T28_08780 [Acinetobacter silvestris]